MRILQLDVNYDDSSTGKIVKDLQTGLERRQHQVKCCYGRGPNRASLNAAKISLNLEVTIHAALTRITGLTGAFSPLATRSLIAEIEEFKPDVVHLHELHGYYINVYQIVRYLKSHQIPVVWTFHCEFMYTGKCGHAHECNRWQVNCGSCPQLNEYPKSFIFDRTALMLRQKKEIFEDFEHLKIITPSGWLAQRVRQSFLRNSNIDVIYNGIDIDIFRPADATMLRAKHKIKTKHVLLSIAPDLLSEAKGGGWVLALARRMKEDDVTFVMVGVDDPSEITAPNVVAIPKVTDKKTIAQYYSMADFTLLTSKKETFSLVCAESLACGTPIIGFDAGAPNEVAPPGYGHFVKYGNIGDLCDSVKGAFADRSNYKSRMECFEFAKRNYSKEQMVESYLAEYKILLGMK